MQCLQQLQSLAQQGEPQASQALAKLSSEMATMPLPPQVILKCLNFFNELLDLKVMMEHMISGTECTICAHNFFGWNRFYLEKQIYEHLSSIAPLPHQDGT